MHTEYLHHAGQIDAKFFKHTSTSPGIGPITKVLSQYPRVKGLGVGAFGEFSTDLEELLELTARARTLEYADTYAVPEGRVISAFVWDTRRRWAMTAIRAISRRRTVTCYLPRSDPQCHGAKIEKEADQGRGDAESPVRVTLGN